MLPPTNETIRAIISKIDTHSDADESDSALQARISRSLADLSSTDQKAVLRALFVRDLNQTYSSLSKTDVLTFAAVILAAQKIQEALHNFSVDLGSEGQAIVTNAGTQLSLNISELKRGVGNRLGNAIDSLGFDLQQTALVLSNAVQNLTLVLQVQIGCLVGELGVFLAGIETVVENLKRGIFFIKAGDPRITNFQFEGQKGSIVPPSGGRVTISGFDLWSANDLPPQITIMDQARAKVIAKPTAERGASKDQVTFMVDESVITSNVGAILDVQVQVFKHGPLGVGKKVFSPLFIAISIPKNVSGSLILEATIYYNCAGQDKFQFPPENFYTDNHSCESKKNFGPETRVLSTDPEVQITKVDLTPTDLDRRVLSASAGFTGGSITVQGELDTAYCFPFSVFHSTAVFSRMATATAVKASEQPAKDSRQSSATPYLHNTAALTVEFKKPCAFTRCDCEFRILRVMPGAQPVELCRSTRFSCDDKGGTAPAISFENMTVDGYCSIGVAAPTVQVAARVRSVSCYGGPGFAIMTA
jgi:hypothetical protein